MTGPSDKRMSDPEPRITTFEGSTRRVVVAGSAAVKFAKNVEGLRCNLEEARLWRLYHDHPKRGALLCPVLWQAEDGAVLVMEAAEPLPVGFEPWRDAEDVWGCALGDDDPCPFEWASENWGLLRGKPVAIDYGLRAMITPNG